MRWGPHMLVLGALTIGGAHSGGCALGEPPEEDFFGKRTPWFLRESGKTLPMVADGRPRGSPVSSVCQNGKSQC